MKRVFVILCLALCFGVATYAWAGRATTKRPPTQVEIISGQGDTYMYSGKDSAGNVVYEVDTRGFQTVINHDAVVINSRSQLSTYSGAGTAGQSVYQTELGKRYFVDPVAIGYSGVTLILPDASTTANTEGVVKIELVNTGTSGYQAWAGAAAGTTSVFVYPYSTGTTQYMNSIYTPQTMFRPVNALVGVTMTQTSKSMGAGLYFTMDYPGESAEFGLRASSQVSTWVIRSTDLN